MYRTGPVQACVGMDLLFSVLGNMTPLYLLNQCLFVCLFVYCLLFLRIIHYK